MQKVIFHKQVPNKIIAYFTFLKPLWNKQKL